MEYSDLTAVTFWQVMQRHLSECRRWYDEAYEWECLITRKKIKGYGCVDIEFAEGEVISLQKLGDASSHAFQMQLKRYQEFQQYVFSKLPSKFTSLPIAYCDDISKIEPRVVALAIEQILREINQQKGDDSLVSRDDLDVLQMQWKEASNFLTREPADCEEFEIERKLAGKDSLFPIYKLLKRTRKGIYVTYANICDELDKPDLPPKTITIYLGRIEVALGIDLDRPRGEKKVSLKR